MSAPPHEARQRVTLTITSLLSILLLSFHLADDIVRPVVHMRGSGLVGGEIAGSNGVFFWVWTLMALGVTATLSMILSARGLWGLRRSKRSAQKRERQDDLIHRRDGA